MFTKVRKTLLRGERAMLTACELVIQMDVREEDDSVLLWNRIKTVNLSMELCPSDCLVTQLNNWYDGDHTFNVVEILENTDTEITMDPVNNVLFTTEGDLYFIQGLEHLEKLGTVLHCNKEWKHGTYFDYWKFDYKTRIDDFNIQLNEP